MGVTNYLLTGMILQAGGSGDHVWTTFVMRNLRIALARQRTDQYFQGDS